MSIQKIITPSGETLVVLPMAEYESLVDAADIAAADAVRRNFANGDDEAVPSEIVNRILDGENPVRVWRDHRNLSAKTVAKKAGISPAYLSEIETGKKEGAVSTLKKIAEALRVDLDDLV
jgi:DNA-binding Xre family transcriptional regulator